MNIAIDVQGILSSNSRKRGIGRYSISQFSAIFKKDTENHYFLFNPYKEDDTLSEFTEAYSNVSQISFYTGKKNFMIINPEMRELFGEIVKKFINDYEIDLFYFTSPFDEWDIYDREWYRSVKIAVTVYDLIQLINKKIYLRDEKILDEYMKGISLLKDADLIFAISENTKNDVMKLLNIDSKKICVIYAGADEIFKRIELPDNIRQALLEKYGIKKKFIMCTSGAARRKNNEKLIEAFGKLPKHIKEEYQLVLTCDMEESYKNKMRAIAKKNHVAQNVIFTGYVPEDDLIKLLNSAYIFAFPSQYEGFGLPVVEAMACGVPVLTSENSSLGEIARNCAVLVDPFSLKSISEGLESMLTKADLNGLIKKGYEEVKKYSWGATAEKTLDVLHGIKYEKKTATVNKIAVFTPLNPLQSGISDYSEDLINSMSKRCAIDIFIDDKYTPTIQFPENVRILNHKKFENMRQEYDVYLYQMGNSIFHTYMLDYIKKFGGTVVLHDYNLHFLLYHISLKHFELDFKKYLEYFEEDYKDSDEAKEYLSSLKTGGSGPRIEEFQLNGTVTNYADRIIVHSDYAKRKLLDNNIDLKVAKIESYAKPLDCSNAAQIREAFKIHQDDIIVAVFGHLSRNKRIDKVVNAFGEVLKEKKDAKLIFVGKPDPWAQQYFKDLFNGPEAQYLKKSITTTGYTKMEQFLDYMRIADICINLRFPHNGETSASASRILAAGKPLIVSNVGTFMEIPDECCIKIDVDGLEERNLKNSIIELIDNPEKGEELRRMAMQYAAENLNIEKISEQYMKFFISYKPQISIDKYISKISETYPSDNYYSIAETVAFLK